MERILLVDDEEGIRIVWKRFHDVVEPVFRGRLEMDVASTLAQGLERIKETEYDALILDLIVPPMGANDMIQWIYDHADEVKIPIVVLTGDSDVYTRRRCIMAGASDFWLKTDAQERPDLFFKSLYNRYLSTYARQPPTA